MDRIEIACIDSPINCGLVGVFGARMTQRGHKIQTMEDLDNLLFKDFDTDFIQKLSTLRHGTTKRFAHYTFAIVGASRRFLAQIRTHQHADFISGSLQYSDWSNFECPEEMFTVPYELLNDDVNRRRYLDGCITDFYNYQNLVKACGNDAAGYCLPNGIRNVLIIQANIQQWQYMIGLRTCRRNTTETRYIMLEIWRQLFEEMDEDDAAWFSPTACGAQCQQGKCLEGHFTCGQPLHDTVWPSEIIQEDYPLLWRQQ